MTDIVLDAADLTAAPVARDRVLGRLWRHRSGRVGLVLLAVYLIVAVFGPLMVLWSPSSDVAYQNLFQALKGPSAQHLLGTDQLGRDEMVRLILGARYTLLIGVGAVALGLVVGVPLGAVSGFYRGWIDLVVQRIVDIVLAFPNFLLALALVAVLGPGLRNVIIAVSLASFPRFVRLVRASVLSVRERPFAEAARAVGVSRAGVLWRYVVPNCMAPVFVQVPLEVGSAILTAAGLGFLGLGVQQPTPEWGAMLGQAQNYIFSQSYLVTFPGLCILGAILAFNLLGDGLRDVFDPRVRAVVRRPKRQAT